MMLLERLRETSELVDADDVCCSSLPLEPCRFSLLLILKTFKRNEPRPLLASDAPDSDSEPSGDLERVERRKKRKKLKSMAVVRGLGAKSS